MPILCLHKIFTDLHEEDQKATGGVSAERQQRHGGEAAGGERARAGTGGRGVPQRVEAEDVILPSGDIVIHTQNTFSNTRIIINVQSSIM